jgi:hypothetical protein
MVDDGRRVRMRLEDFSGKKKEKRCGTRHQRLHFLPPSGKAGRDPHAKGPRRSRQKLRFLFLGHASSINEGKMGNGAMAIHHHPSIHPSITHPDAVKKALGRRSHDERKVEKQNDLVIVTVSRKSLSCCCLELLLFCCSS